MDLKHILKRLLRTPLFTAVTVLTLAIGIGANTAIFSVIDGILLRPLPFHDPDELVAVDHAAPGVNLENAGAAPFLYFTYREDAKTFQDIGALEHGHGEPDRAGRARGDQDAQRDAAVCCRCSASSRWSVACSRGRRARTAARRSC